MMGRTQVRPEGPEDLEAVRRVNTEAFGRTGEADLVDALRAHGKAVVSLVALEEGGVAGHILFSPVEVDGSEGLRMLGLAPMAVLPSLQRRGLGTMLVREGLRLCSDAGYDAVVVLGHPEYYPRFGFVPASTFGLSSEYEVPDEAFMTLELREGALEGVSGKARFAVEFSELPED
jgi:putative acetyltransferase